MGMGMWEGRMGREGVDDGMGWDRRVLYWAEYGELLYRTVLLPRLTFSPYVQYDTASYSTPTYMPKKKARPTHPPRTERTGVQTRRERGGRGDDTE